MLLLFGLQHVPLGESSISKKTPARRNAMSGSGLGPAIRRFPLRRCRASLSQDDAVVAAASQRLELADVGPLQIVTGKSGVFQDRDRWVFFTDLHVRKQTLQICLDVLRFVHNAAVERDAGIAFLGDFWHTRGDLPVEPLNAILKEFSEWKQPLVMIPGNHDQVSFDGELHALEAISHAVPQNQALVFSRPTVYLDALWLPFRRNEDDLKSALESPEAKHIKTVFCHVDVMGAVTNTGARSERGFAAEQMFEPHLRVFSGHFHKPQIIRNRQIRYLGSAYQVTAKEANQKKQLVVFDREWNVTEEIPIDVGPRYFSLKPGDDVEDTLASVRPNDVVDLEVAGSMEARRDSLVKEFEAKGVNIVVREMNKVASTARIEQAETLSPSSVFDEYAKFKVLSQEVASRGREVINGFLSDSGTSMMNTSLVGSKLKLRSFRLEGFGSFEKPVSYDLNDRGVVLVVGENAAERGADSNGAGKTTLLVAPLWCLTGYTDPRPEGTKTSGLSTEMLNDSVKSGYVSVTATIDGRDLVVTRQLRRNGQRVQMHLEVALDGFDETKQSREETQALLDSVIGSPNLLRSCFLGQHSATRSPLELTDKGLKDELANLVPIERWTEIKDRATSLRKDARSSLDRQLGGIEEAQRQLAAQATRLNEAVDSLKEKKTLVEDQLAGLKDRKEALELERTQQLQEHRKLQETQEKLDQLNQHLQQSEKVYFECETKYSNTKETLRLWNERESRALDELTRARDAASHAIQWEESRARREEELAKDLETLDVNDVDVEELQRSLLRVQEEHRRHTLIGDSNDVSDMDSERSHAEEGRKKAMQRLNECKAVEAALLKRVEGADKFWAQESHRHEVAVCDQCLQPVPEDVFNRQRDAVGRELEIANAEVNKCRVDVHVATVELRLVTERQEQADKQMQRAQRQKAEELLNEERQLTEQLNTAGRRLAKAEELTAALKRQQEDENPYVRLMRTYLADELKDGASVPSVISDVVETYLARHEQDYKDTRAQTDELRAGLEGLGAELERARITQQTLQLSKTEAETSGGGSDGASVKAARTELELEKVEDEMNRARADLGQAARHAESAKNVYLQTEKRVKELEQLASTTSEEAEMLEKLEEAFGVRGVQSFILESALSELEQTTKRYLSELCAGELELVLSPFRSTKKTANLVERIEKTVRVLGEDGTYAARSVRQLSGGQRQRVSLAFSLAMLELVEQRRGPTINVLVFDEALMHLDEEGKDRFTELAQRLGRESVFFVAQNITEQVAARARSIDLVKRSGEGSIVIVDHALERK